MAAYLLAFIAPLLLLPLRKKSSTAYVFVLAGLWSVFAGLRLDIGGKDYFTYRDAYASIASGSIGIGARFEPLFQLLMQFFHGLGMPYHGFLLIVAILGILPAVYVVERRSGDSPIGLYVYGIEFMLYGSFVILRQGIAIGIAFLVIDAVMDRKPVKALIFSILAAGFHYSGLILLLYPLFSKEFSPRLRNAVFAVAAAAGATLLVVALSSLSSLIWTSFTDPFIHYIAGGGGMRINPLNFIEVITLFYLMYRYAWDAAPVLKNAFLMLLIFTLYGTIEAIFVRFGSYFKIAVVLLLPLAVTGAAPEKQNRHRFETNILQLGIFCYYLAKITRWLILNLNDIAVFLPYRTIFG
ncbi:MAG: EpsG family protein [Spirochaetales bacterium]